MSKESHIKPTVTIGDAARILDVANAKIVNTYGALDQFLTLLEGGRIGDIAAAERVASILRRSFNESAPYVLGSKGASPCPEST